MKKSYPLLLLLLFIASAVYAQYNAPQGKIWAFGHQAGLDFTNGNPVPVTTQMSPYNSSEVEGCASVCDANGNLLFYCTGNRVWNRYNNIMPNGSNILPLNVFTDNSTQGTVITPVPGDAAKYYIFSLQQASANLGHDECRLYYSVVDMNRNNGYGDVIPNRSGILLDSNLSEAMTTVPGDYCDVWVVVHGLGNHIFKSYHITNYGISAPVLSNTGTFSGNKAYISGVMKCSPNRHKLVVCTNERGTQSMSMGAELCDFSPATGNVSNAIAIDTSVNGYGVYGAAFSADNTKLYLHTKSYTTAVNMVLQFDLSLPAATIIGSRYLVYLKRNLSDMKLGPDGKIYLGSDDSARALDCITDPGQGGPACHYTRSAVILQPGTSISIGLPNAYASVNPADTIIATHDTFICKQTLAPFALHAVEGYNYYRWYDGSQADTVIVNDTGKYWVYSYETCDVHIDTFRVKYLTADTLHNKITANICTPNNTTLVAPAGYLYYTWNDDSENNTRVVSTAGTYWLYSVKTCVVRVDSFIMQNQVDLSFSLGKDTSICSPIILSVSLQDVSYRWQDGNSSRLYVADHSGTYYVTVSKQGCSYTDTIHIAYYNIDQHLNDAVYCDEEPIDMVLEANTPKGSSALWSDGSTAQTLHITDTGKYWVKVSAGNCVVSDTANIVSGPCECLAILPNAFSPNGDGKNDLFRAIQETGCNFSAYSLDVYNRWGDRVFHTEDINEGWDGTYKGREAVADVYMYVVQYRSGVKAKKHSQKGDVTLIR